jgi:membrane-associated phospholipid phosphatase
VKHLKFIQRKTIIYPIIMLAIIIVFTLLFFNIADSLRENEIRSFDESIIGVIQGNISPSHTEIMLFFTFLGSITWITCLTIAIMVLLLVRKHKLLALFILISNAGGALFNYVLKSIFKRARPTIQPLIEEKGFSFPSGHSMCSFIIYGSIAFLIYRLSKSLLGKTMGTIVSISIIFAVGTSRIYLGVHYPSDVVGGFTAGGVWLIVMIIFYYFLKFRMPEKPE